MYNAECSSHVIHRTSPIALIFGPGELPFPAALHPAPAPPQPQSPASSTEFLNSVLICGVTKQPQHHGRILSGHRAPSVIRCRDTHTAPSFIVLVQSRVLEMFSLKTESNSSKSSEQLLCKRSKYSRSPMKYKIVYLVESFV